MYERGVKQQQQQPPRPSAEEVKAEEGATLTRFADVVV